MSVEAGNVMSVVNIVFVALLVVLIGIANVLMGCEVRHYYEQPTMHLKDCISAQP